jgi:acyl carrier protein
MQTTDQVITVLAEVLQLGGRARMLDDATPLLGSLPELDSMAVATVIGALEERFGIFVEDEELSAETFRTVGSLAEFVDQKLVVSELDSGMPKHTKAGG